MHSHISGFVCGLRHLCAACMVNLLFTAIKQVHPRIPHLLSPCAQHRTSWSHLSALTGAELIHSIFFSPLCTT